MESIISNYFDIGIIIGIILITQFIKERLHQSLKVENEIIDYKIMPFIPLVFGIFAGVSVAFRDNDISFWNIIWQSIKYAGAATFLYKVWSRFGRDLIEKIIRKKLEE